MCDMPCSLQSFTDRRFTDQAWSPNDALREVRMQHCTGGPLTSERRTRAQVSLDRALRRLCIAVRSEPYGRLYGHR